MNIKKLKELHAKGLTDVEIGKAMSLTRRNVAYYRVKHGLKLNRKSKRTDIVKLKKLHAQGFTDRQLAEELGVHHGTITYHRERLKLKINYDTTTRRLNENDLKKIEGMYYAGMNDREIAEKLGQTDVAIEQYEKAVDIEDSFRVQFRLMYPGWEMFSRLGEEKYKNAKQRIKELCEQPTP